MEEENQSEKLSKLLAQAEGAELYSEGNFTILDRVMRQYWLIVKDLNTAAPHVFNNLATNGVIDLINRSNLTEESVNDKDKRNNYKDYRDYLSYSIKITIEYIKNYLPSESAASS